MSPEPAQSDKSYVVVLVIEVYIKYICAVFVYVHKTTVCTHV